VERGADYVLSLKDNHPLLAEEVASYFEHAQQDRTLDARPLKTSREAAYYLTSRGPDAEVLGRLIRRHWAARNELHWVLDMVFDEDRLRIRDRNAATNLALLRKLSLTLRGGGLEEG
jgi:predicted transposase YbfD/YdcC